MPRNSPPIRPLEWVSMASEQDGHGFDLWHEVCRPLFDTVSRAPLPSFETAFRFCNVDGLIFNRVRYSATNYKRTGQHLRGGDGDFIIIHMLLSGSEQGRVDGRPFRMDPQRIIIQDWAHSYETTSEDTEQISVAIPRERLAASGHLYEKHPVIDLAKDSPKGMILGTALLSTWEALPHATQSDAPAIAAGFLGMLEGLLSPSGRSNDISGPGRASSAAMRDYLNQRLHDPTLGIDSLAGAFNCSRSTIFRLFKDCNGVRGFLTEHRLSEAYRILTQPESLPASIASIARSLGFSDVGYFHRLFKKRFGMTAGEARELGAFQISGNQNHACGAAMPELKKLQQWLGGGI